MPQPYLHIHIANEVSKCINEKYNILLHNTYLNYGSLGADVLFFSKRREVKGYGELIHNISNHKLTTQLMKISEQDKSIETLSFCIGYLTHIITDTIFHKFVYYYSGIYNNSKKETHKYRGKHFNIEKQIDKIIVRDIFKKNFSTITYNKYFNKIKDVRDISPLINMFYYNLIEVKALGHINYYSLLNLATLNKRLSKDLFGIKKIILTLLGLFNRKSEIKLKDLSNFNFKTNLIKSLTNDLEYRDPYNNVKHKDSINSLIRKSIEVIIDSISINSETLDLNINNDFINTSNQESGKIIIDKSNYKYFFEE